FCFLYGPFIPLNRGRFELVFPDFHRCCRMDQGTIVMCSLQGEFENYGPVQIDQCWFESIWASRTLEVTISEVVTHLGCFEAHSDRFLVQRGCIFVLYLKVHTVTEARLDLPIRFQLIRSLIVVNRFY